MSEFNLLTSRITPGTNVIEASAGTGKTWSVAHLVPRLIIDGAVDRLDQILLVSFTEDATRELAERVRATLADLTGLLLEQDSRPEISGDLVSLLDKARKAAKDREEEGLALLIESLKAQPAKERPARTARLLAARLDADRLVVNTIHGLCRRILSDEGFLCGIPSGFEVAPEISDLRSQALRDTWRQELAANPFLARLALRRGWKLEDDDRAWRKLEPIDSERLLPDPCTLEAGQKAVKNALEKFKAAASDLAGLRNFVGAAIENKVGINNAGKGCPLKEWDALFAGLNPDQPSGEVLERLAALADAPAWFNKRSSAGKQAVVDVVETPSVKAAQAVLDSLVELDWAWRGHALAGARERLESFLIGLNALSYNGLIRKVGESLLGSHGYELGERLRRRWKVAMVDESQDTDQRQLDIFERVFSYPDGDSSLILIGDPKQSIYGFRGADLGAYQGAKTRSGHEIFELTKTWRSAEGLVGALNRLFSRPTPLASSEINVPSAAAARRDDERPLPEGITDRLCISLVREDQAPAFDRAPKRLTAVAKICAAQISKVLGKQLADKKRSVQPGDCAVLTRSNRQGRAVRDALVKVGIPAVIREDGDVLVSEIAGDLLVLLAAVQAFDHRGLRRAALATRLFGLDGADLHKLADTADEDWQLTMKAWQRTWEEHGIAALLARIDRDKDVSGRLAGLPDGERHLTDLRHLSELLGAESAGRSLAPGRLLAWLESAVAAAQKAGDGAEYRLRRLEKDGSAVQVLTVHRCKGLEWEFCFLPFMWDAKTPKDSASRITRLENGEGALIEPERMGEKERQAILDRGVVEGLEEDMRLAYVALTRAKRRVWVLAGWIGYADGHSKVAPSALDWLLRMPREGEDVLTWFRRMEIQKKSITKTEEKAGRKISFECEHAEALNELFENDNLVSVIDTDEQAVPCQAYNPIEGELKAEEAPPVPGEWDITSFSSFVDGSYGPGVHNRDDKKQGKKLPFAGIWGGTTLGSAIHELTEKWDFKDLPPGLDGILKKHGVFEKKGDQGNLSDILAKQLPTWGEVEIPGLGLLSKVAEDPRLSEWHFMLPVKGERLEPFALADAFEHHPDPRLSDYAGVLRGLNKVKMAGLLQGFIDRIVRSGAQWAVVDWKTNNLGDLDSDYTDEAMLQVAVDHHYVLQIHLYLLALRRHLLGRSETFQANKACLVFLRAVEGGSSKGVLSFDVDDDFLDRLGVLFDREES